MARSSESVAALAAALAKAQAELVNPEKSLVATVQIGRPGDGKERSFRYASLASGLDIVRKTLSRYEIAVVQTTALDQPSGLVNLTTALVHPSGEWIASDWPVCTIADMASPQRMGAALTYARRYGLFTLVGIAGDDDLDAPDLHDRCHEDWRGDGARLPNVQPAARQDVRPVTAAPARKNRANGRGTPGVTEASVLPPDQSAKERDRLLLEIGTLSSPEAAAVWAQGVLVVKNTLIAADAKLLETAFEARLALLGQPADQEAAVPTSEVAVESTAEAVLEVPKVADMQVARPKERRYRSRLHLRFVAAKPCIVCGRKPSDPHHLRFAQPRALGRKVSDEFVVPLCRIHHRLVHRVGNEAAWWKEAAIDPLETARKLWAQTRGAEPIA